MNPLEYKELCDRIIAEAKVHHDYEKIASGLLNSPLASIIYTRGRIIAKLSGIRGRGLVFYLIPFLALYSAVRQVFGIPDKEQYTFGVRSYSTDMGFMQPNQSLATLAGIAQRTEQLGMGDRTLYCGEGVLSSDREQEYRKRNLSYVRTRDFLKFGDYRSAMRSWLDFARIAHRMTPVDRRTTADILHKYLIWTGFLRCYDLKRYVVYEETVPSAIVRIILMRERGIKTIWIMTSANFWWMYAGGKEVTDPVYIGLVADILYAWDEEHVNLMKHHTQNIQDYRIIGCPWAEPIREYRDRRIIALFDTSAGEMTPVTQDDLDRFHRDILRLANTGKFNILFKPKHETPDFLKNHKFIEIAHDVGEALKQCDLVIGMPFTSPGYEAEQAGIRALYFNPGGKIEGRYPVIHTYDELLKELA